MTTGSESPGMIRDGLEAATGSCWGTADGAARLLAMSLQVISGFALLALSAQVRVPFPGTDVPGTLQLLAVLLLGLGLSRAAAIGSVALYLLCGGLGFGVFASGSAGLVGPTGGYLAGFGVAVYLMGMLRGTRLSPIWRLWLAGLAGAGVVLGFGVAGRLLWLGDWSWAVATGFVPFVMKALIEVSLAAALVFAGRRVADQLAD